MSKPRILVIGGRGFIGEHVCRAACEHFQVFRGSRSAPAAPGDVQIDIADPASVDSAFALARPGIVVLLAAMADIDVCEREPQVAERVNVQGAAHVARASARSGARLIFASTGAVFDGTIHGYREEDPVTPVGVYGRSKARAESLVASLLEGAVIARFSLVLGFATEAAANCLLNRLRAQWSAGQAVSLPTFEFRNPIDAPSLARFLLELAQKPGARGIYHLGGTESLSRYDLGLLLAGRMGFPQSLVQPLRASPPGRAPRGPDHFLLTGKVQQFCRTPVPNLAQVVERSVDGIA